MPSTTTNAGVAAAIITIDIGSGRSQQWCKLASVGCLRPPKKSGSCAAVCGRGSEQWFCVPVVRAGTISPVNLPPPPPDLYGRKHKQPFENIAINCKQSAAFTDPDSQIEP